jgi:NADH dehydrogenase
VLRSIAAEARFYERRMMPSSGCNAGFCHHLEDRLPQEARMQVFTGRKVATVFGGQGFLGRYVVERLAQQDWIVRVASRRPADAGALKTQVRVGQVVPVRASLGDEAAVARAVDGAGLVVNLVGILAERRAGDFMRVHAEGAGRVARLAAAAGVARFVQVSAIGADPASPSAYGRSKAAGEAAVRAAFPAASILRPSIVFGPEDQFFNRFAGLATMLPFMPVVRGAVRFQPVYVGDVAEAVLLAEPGVTYELGGPRIATFRELLAWVVALSGHKRPLVAMPEALVSLQIALTSWMPAPPLTRDQRLMLRRDNVAAPGMPGLATLGIAPTAMESVVPGYLGRYRER